MKSQKFNYSKIEEQLLFDPSYLEKKTLKIQRGIISNIKSYNPDIVLVSECGIVALIVILYRLFCKKKYKIVSIIDDSYNMIAEDNQFSWRHELAEKLLVPHFDNVINVEPRVTEYFQKKYNKGIFFPIIVDDILLRNKYKELLTLSEVYINQYQLENKKVLLFVGRLVKLKNLQTAVPAFKQINDPEMRFVIVGSGEYEIQLKEIANDDNRIIFVGRKEGDELYAWYNVAQCFILPSYQEPFGAVTNEALLAGCRVIVSDLAGSQCLVREGENGYHINPHDINDIRDKVKVTMESVVPISKPILKSNLMVESFDNKMNDVLRMFQNL